MPQNAAGLPEKDQFHNILSLLKQCTSEYGISVTEASCTMVRQTMQRLLNETMMEQGECFQVMQRQGWYPQGDAAPRQAVRKVIQSARQAAQETAQVVSAHGLRPLLQKIGPVPYQTQYGQPQPPAQPQFQPVQAWASQPQYWQGASPAGGMQMTAGGQGNIHAQTDDFRALAQDPSYWRPQNSAIQQQGEVH